MDAGLEVVNEKLAGRRPRAIVQWATDRYSSRIAMSSSFQTQSLPLLHIVSQVAPELPIIFLETGYHFPKTLSFRDKIVDSWGLNLREMTGDKERERAASQDGTPLYKTDPDTCCHINKVRPMDRALQDYDAWISGIRRDQSPARADIDIVEVNEEERVRIHPMASWTEADIDAYVEEHDLPEHPLTKEGYTSIGCWPCTKKPTGGDARSGRWEGTEKEECGLHTELRDDDG